MAVTCFYDHAVAHKRSISWELLRQIYDLDNSPWLVGGDLNSILWSHESTSFSLFDSSLIADFRKAIDHHYLRDMDFTDSMFTWCNNCFGSSQVWKRLDRFLCNDSFFCFFFQEFDARTSIGPNRTIEPLLLIFLHGRSQSFQLKINYSDLMNVGCMILIMN